MKFRILFGAAVVAASATVATALVGPAAIAKTNPWPKAYTCTGGDFATGNLTIIPSGTYASITVTGACAVAPHAVITVLGNVNVAPDAVLDAQSAPSTITVGQEVTAAPGSLLGLGCLPNPPGHMTGHPCAIDPAGRSHITIRGNILGAGANTILLNGITVKQSVTLIRGGDQAGNPWPIKDNTIAGNVTVIGATPEWLGLILNQVGGNVLLYNVTIATGGTIQVALNTIRRNLACYGLAPAVAGGVIPGEVNIVGGKALGQCAHLHSG